MVQIPALGSGKVIRNIEHSYADVNECLPNGGRGPCAQICTNTIGSFSCSCQPGYAASGYACNGNSILLNIHALTLNELCFQQISMSVLQMEDWVHVDRIAPTPLDPSTAAVQKATTPLDMVVMVTLQMQNK